MFQQTLLRKLKEVRLPIIDKSIFIFIYFVHLSVNLCFVLFNIPRRGKAKAKVRPEIENIKYDSYRVVHLGLNHYVLFCFSRLGFVPGLVPPKIPDGEKVDFDVSLSQD